MESNGINESSEFVRETASECESDGDQAQAITLAAIPTYACLQPASENELEVQERAQGHDGPAQAEIWQWLAISRGKRERRRLRLWRE